MAIIGYPCNSTIETGPLPDPGHIFTGFARFWQFNSRRVPDSHAPYPIMATNTWALRPTAHTRAIPGSCSKLSTAIAFFQIRLTLCPSLSYTHNQPNRSHTQPHSAQQLRQTDHERQHHQTRRKAVLPRHKGLADRRGRVLRTRQPLVHREQEQWRKAGDFCSGKEGGCDAQVTRHSPEAILHALTCV